MCHGIPQETTDKLTQIDRVTLERDALRAALREAQPRAMEMDHHLCAGKIPGGKSAEDLALLRRKAAALDALERMLLNTPGVTWTKVSISRDQYGDLEVIGCDAGSDTLLEAIEAAIAAKEQG